MRLGILFERYNHRKYNPPISINVAKNVTIIPRDCLKPFIYITANNINVAKSTPSGRISPITSPANAKSSAVIIDIFASTSLLAKNHVKLANKAKNVVPK
jgi:DNA repair protein RadC